MGYIVFAITGTVNKCSHFNICLYQLQWMVKTKYELKPFIQMLKEEGAFVLVAILNQDAKM